MTAPQNFRSAFNGFNREDVVNHISYMTAKHDAQVNQLKSEAEALRAELEELRTKIDESDEARDQVPALEEKLEKTANELFTTREELQTANQLLSEQEAQIADLHRQLDLAREEAASARAAAAAAPAAIERSSHWDELKAYRRAETVERRARERVNVMYDSASAALAEASAKLGSTTGRINELTEAVRADLVALQEAIDDGCGALSATVDTISGLRPEADE